MATKKRNTSKSDNTVKLLQIIAQLSERITQLGGAYTALKAEVDRAYKLNDSRAAVAGKNYEEVEKFGKNTTASLYALRDNTQKAFTQVSGDFQKLTETVQKLNERLGQIDSKADVGSAAWKQMVGLETRIKVLDDYRKYNDLRLVSTEAILRALTTLKFTGQDSKGTYELIHPYDFSDMLQSAKTSDVVSEENYQTYLVDGKRYMQSPFVPQRGNNYR